MSCGMSAINTVFELFNPGDHILLTENLYGGTLRLGEPFSKYNIEFEYIDTTDLKLVENSIRSNTRAIFLETPSNPMMLVSDIGAIAQLAHSHKALLIVDNTFLTPHFQKPLTLGADIVVHSGTKYLCGHNDLLAGFVTLADNEELLAAMELYVKSTGANLSAQDSWLMLRSLNIDFEDFEAKIKANDVKLFILCSPHNPVGRVWSRDELIRLAEICLAHGVIIVSDEIHHEFVRPGHKHTVLASISEEIAQNTVTCTAPSKTFNLAGLQVSSIFIKNDRLRRSFRDEVAAVGYSQPNSLGLFACQAAYTHEDQWLTELKAYLESNYQKAKALLA